MGVTHPASPELAAEENMVQKQEHPFEHSQVQKLFRTFLRFVTCYLRKLTTLGKTVSG